MEPNCRTEAEGCMQKQCLAQIKKKSTLLDVTILFSEVKW
jgi:hypothetical protein